jgi:TetR/AcrR family fatty acid metabolism transcriptional regulator
MSRTPQPYRKEKEGSIFEAALKVIKRKGFHKARMSDIAVEAGISYGLVYHYFKNKEDLFDAILNRWWDGLFRLMREIAVAADMDVSTKLRQVISFFLDTYQNQPELVNIFITEISRSSGNLTADRLDRFREFMNLTEGLIAEGQRKGVLRRDFKARYLTYIFLGALEAFISTMVLAEQTIRGDAQKQRITESILEVFLNGARSRGAENAAV